MNTETGTPYSREQLKEAFDLVCNKDNWKYPIKSECRADQRDIVLQAVIFYTGGAPTFTPIGNTDRFKVEGPGYYAICGP